MKHGEPITEKPAGPAGTGPQEAPPRLPPGAVGHEVTDVKAPAISKALAILVVGSIVVVVLLLPMFLWLRSRAERREPPPPPMGRREAGRQPAEPRLQTRPVDDLAAIRAGDEQLLQSYGWVDEANGVVHIPIELAMRIIAERGLPATAPAPAASAPAGTGGLVPAAPATPAAPASPGGHR